jgi:hypothetical protein
MVHITTNGHSRRCSSWRSAAGDLSETKWQRAFGTTWRLFRTDAGLSALSTKEDKLSSVFRQGLIEKRTVPYPILLITHPTLWSPS